MSKKLYVGNLSYDTTESQLEELFAEIGPVGEVAVVQDRMTGRSRGFGFVEMTNDADAAKAIEQLNGTQLDGRSLNVSEAKPRADRDDRGGSRGGGSRGGFGGAGRGGGGGGRDSRRNSW